MKRVRFAPSPTGNLHIGTIRTALFNWLYAKHHNGTFITRIEDTDLERSNPVYETSIFDGLNWLGITSDEDPIKGGPCAPYRQSERMKDGLYDHHIDILLKNKTAYPCFCTDHELDAEREQAKHNNVPYVYSGKCANLTPDQVAQKKAENRPYTIRFKMPTGSMTFQDIIRGEIEFDLALLSDFVIKKSDGSPTYNFAVVVDDITMNITHVIRGEDHISNTPRQIAIFQALGHPAPQFAHLPMILGPDKSKLSKRHGATAITDYANMGYVPDAMLNGLALLGWTSPSGNELLSADDIIADFDLDRIGKSGAVFDLTKINWLNGQYIRKMDIDTFAKACAPFMSQETQLMLDDFAPTEQNQILAAIQDNVTLLPDVNEYIPLFNPSLHAFKDRLAQFEFSDTDKHVLTELRSQLDSAHTLTPDSIHTLLEAILTKTGFPKGKVFKPIRLGVSAFPSGPDLGQLLTILGKKRLIERIDYAIGHSV